jgi:hypothetical protein
LFVGVVVVVTLLVSVSAKHGRVHNDNAIKIDAMRFMDKILSLSMGYIISFFVTPRNDKKMRSCWVFCCVVLSVVLFTSPLLIGFGVFFQ